MRIWENLKGYEQPQQHQQQKTKAFYWNGKFQFSNQMPTELWLHSHMLIVIAMPTLLTSRSYLNQQPQMWSRTHVPMPNTFTTLCIFNCILFYLFISSCVCASTNCYGKQAKFAFLARTLQLLLIALPCLALPCFVLLFHIHIHIHSMEINWNIAVSLICNRLFIHMCSFRCSYHFRFFSVLRYIA